LPTYGPADLVRDAGQGDVALDERTGQQVVERQGHRRSTIPEMRSDQVAGVDLRAR
jgi:hypothetical protein